MVEILDETNRFAPAERVGAALSTLASELGVGDRDVTVILVGDAAIRELNAEHRGVDAPTDVLSYPMHEPDDVGMPAVDHLGDVFVSVDTAARQAPEHGHNLEEEVAVLAAHGIVHLTGLDHADEADWQPFRWAQSRVLAALREDSE